MTIKYPKLHNRAFSMVAMSLLAISCLNCGKGSGSELGSGSGQNDRKQENVESQKNDLSLQEFVNQLRKITEQKELPTLDTYNNALSALDGFPEDIKEFLQSKQQNLSDREFANQLIHLIEQKKDLSDQQFIKLVRIIRLRIGISTINKGVQEPAKIHEQGDGTYSDEELMAITEKALLDLENSVIEDYDHVEQYVKQIRKLGSEQSRLDAIAQNKKIDDIMKLADHVSMRSIAILRIELLIFSLNPNDTSPFLSELDKFDDVMLKIHSDTMNKIYDAVRDIAKQAAFKK